MIAEREKRSANAGRLEAVSAFGPWAWWVPNGHIGVAALPVDEQAGPAAVPRYFLTPDEAWKRMTADGRPYLVDEAASISLLSEPPSLTSRAVNAGAECSVERLLKPEDARRIGLLGDGASCA